MNQSEPDAAFLAISMGRPYYSTTRLLAYISWANLKYASFAFLVGDWLYGLTLQTLKELSPAEANNRAINKGDDVRRQLQELVPRLRPRAEIIMWSELRKRPEYTILLSRFRNLHEADRVFAKEVRDQAFINLGSRIAVAGVSRDSSKRSPREILLDEYILNEVTGLVCMSEHLGYPLELYPGPDLKIMQQIYAGRWVGTLDHIAHPLRRQHLELQVEPEAVAR